MNNLNISDYGSDESTRKGSRNRIGWLLVMLIVAIPAAPAYGVNNGTPALTSADCAPPFPDSSWIHCEVNPANGHAYVLLNLPLAAIPVSNSVPNLRTEAANIGGFLVTVNDLLEDNWIDEIFFDVVNTLGADSIVTGFSDEVVEGTWVWDSGQEAPWVLADDPDRSGGAGNDTYDNWRSDAPNNAGTGGEENHMRKEYNSGLGHPDFGTFQDFNGDVTSGNPGLVEIEVFPIPIEFVLTVDKSDGTMTLSAVGAEVIFDSYNITSAAGALDSGSWITSNLASQAPAALTADLEPDGDVDGFDFLAGQLLGPDPTGFFPDFDAQYGQTGGGPGDQWEVLNATTSQLFEAYLSGDETVAADMSISIGTGYDTTNGTEDLEFTFSLPNGKTLTGVVTYINGLSASTASVAVPEPSTMALVMLAALFGIVTLGLDGSRRRNCLGTLP